MGGYANQAAAIRLAGRSQSTLAKGPLSLPLSLFLSLPLSLPLSLSFSPSFSLFSFFLSCFHASWLVELGPGGCGGGGRVNHTAPITALALEEGGSPSVLEQSAIARTPLCFSIPVPTSPSRTGTPPPPPPIAVGPPRRSPLCAPAVPLLWLQLVLLCFRVATIEPPPPLGSSPHPPPPCSQGSSGRRGLCLPRRCPTLLKGGVAEAAAAYCWGGRLFKRDPTPTPPPPPVAGPDPREATSGSWLPLTGSP